MRVWGPTRLGREQVTGAGGAGGADAWDSRSLTSLWATLRGITKQGPATSQGTLPGPAGRSPVALVVHRNEVHEEHVVGHGVHAEELHLKRGEHAPGGGEASGHLRWGRAGLPHLDQPRPGGFLPAAAFNGLAPLPPLLSLSYSNPTRPLPSQGQAEGQSNPLLLPFSKAQSGSLNTVQLSLHAPALSYGFCHICPVERA